MLSYIYGKPHKKPSKDTLRRRITQSLKKAGINTEIYTAHSTSHASASKSKINCCVQTILSKVVVSQNQFSENTTISLSVNTLQKKLLRTPL